MFGPKNLATLTERRGRGDFFSPNLHPFFLIKCKWPKQLHFDCNFQYGILRFEVSLCTYVCRLSGWNPCFLLFINTSSIDQGQMLHVIFESIFFTKLWLKIDGFLHNNASILKI
jgi:hypothetical protein